MSTSLVLPPHVHHWHVRAGAVWVVTPKTGEVTQVCCTCPVIRVVPQPKAKEAHISE